MQSRRRGKVNAINPFRLGKKENYVNDHELYELLRSRELFRLQFELRKSLKRQLRGLAETQKVTMAILAAKKRIFMHQVSSKNKFTVINVQEELQIIESEVSNVLQNQESVDLEKVMNEMMEPKVQPKPKKFTRERIIINPSAEDLIENSFIQRLLNSECCSECSMEAIDNDSRLKYKQDRPTCNSMSSDVPSASGQFLAYRARSPPEGEKKASENIVVKKGNRNCSFQQKELEERVKYFILHCETLCGENKSVK